MAASLPSGTVTFLFTDVESSTRRWEDPSAEMAEKLEVHDELVRSTVEGVGGYVFATGGDGFATAFGTAADAATAAVAAQRELALPVRMGLHSGAAHERDGNFFGSAVNRAARVMAAAHGGQILCSRATADLLADSDGLGLADLGTHHLRDLERPEQLFQLTAEGLEAEFPAVRGLESYRGNLPTQRSAFIGRDSFIAQVCAASEESRLVTLTGVGGVGKTRVAVQAAADQLPVYDHGAWLVELAAVNERDGVEEALATALSIRRQPGLVLRDAILGQLRSRDLLLILDNCEHVLDDVSDLVEDLLESCSALRILATSREGLAIEGERLLAVPSLALPGNEEPVEDAEAVRLFLARARDRDPSFAVDEASLESIAELCRRLDGVPLALELAAARLTVMTPTEMVDHLDERFELLTGGRRRSRERHQTLRRAVDWSYDLLDSDEQEAMARLAVFASSFDRDAAEAVLEQPAGRVIELLASLVEKSLLSSESDAGQTRYRYLETIRQYAEDRIEEQGSIDAVMRLSFDYFVDWTRHCTSGLIGPEEFGWDAKLELELPNIRRCYEWAADRESWADVCALLGPYAAAGFGSGMRVAAWPLDVIEDLAESGERLAGRVIANAATTWPAEAVGTIELLEQAEKVAVRNGDDSCIAYWLYQAFSAGTDERAPVVIDRTDEMVTRALALGELTPAVGCLTGRALAKVTLGLGGAEGDARRAYEIAKDSSNPSTVGIGCFALTHALRATDPASALEAVREGLDICGEGPIGAVLDNDLALLLIILGREDELMEHVSARLGFAPQAAGVSALAAATVPALVKQNQIDLAVEVVASTAPYLTVLSQYRAIHDRAIEALPPDAKLPPDAAADPEDVRDRLLAWLEVD